MTGGAGAVDPWDGQMPGARYAMNIVHPGSPVLRVRYREGVLVDPYGFPDWLLYARALVDVPRPVRGLGIDEVRVLDVLAANLAVARSGDDPLWTDPGDSPLVGTPAGWCWAHLGLTRRLALVPVELHGAYRHGGGVRTTPVDSDRRGVRCGTGEPGVGTVPGDEVPDEILTDVEEMLGVPLPATYREYLATTNGAAPDAPAVLPDRGVGLLVDQPLFGLARADQHQDLAYAREWLADRFTGDLLPIGYVQGGMLAVGLTGPDADTVWYWDDDDPRDEAGYDAAHIRGRLLHRCADSFAGFWAALRRPPATLLELADEWVSAGLARTTRDEMAGVGLPGAMRAPWQPPPDKRTGDSVVDLFTPS